MSTKLAERRTTDRRLAAYLITTGAQLLDTVVAGDRVYFVFDETPAVEAAVQRYVTGQATAEVRTFAGAFGYLKPLAKRAWEAADTEAQK